MREFLLGCVKNFLLRLYKLSLNLFVSNLLRMRKSTAAETAVFFAGAIPGSRGGPRVKVSRLKKEFRQNPLAFNLDYVLSNYPYLNSYNIKVLRKKSIPIVLNQNGVYHPSWFGDNFDEANAANKMIYQNSTYVFWQSEFARRASQKFLDVSDPRGEILYNAVDLDSFFPSKESKSRTLFRFLIAGKFTPNTLYQIEAGLRGFSLFKVSQRAELLIAGLTEAQKLWAAQLASKLGILDYVQFQSPYEQKEAPSLMRNVDAYLALKHMDTCPNLVIEALASGVPVIYSDSGGTPELVGPDAGIGLPVAESWDSGPFVPQEDVIAGSMLEIMTVRDKMAKIARLRAEEMFDIQSWYRRHEEVFEFVREEN